MDSSLLSALTPDSPTIQRYRTQAPELLSQAEALVIADDAGLAEAAELTRMTTGAVKGIKELFAGPKRNLDAAKRSIAALEADLLGGFQRADAIFRQKLTDYHVARERARADERPGLEAEAKRKADDEKLADAVRLENLANATGDAHYRKAAEQTLDRPSTVTVYHPPPRKTAGISFRQVVGAEVDDFGALIAAVAAGTVERDALLPNASWLCKEAEQRGEAFAVPGVRRTVRDDVTVRA